MTKTTNWAYIAIPMLASLALAACSSTTVVRKSGVSPAQPRVSTPKYGANTVVQRGDTLYGIAFRNGVDVRDLAQWNGISAPYTIYPGQRLRLYPGKAAAPVATRPAAAPTRVPATTTSPPHATATGPASTGPAATGAATASPSSTPAPPAPVPSTPVASGLDWRWPVDGQLISRFVAGEPTKQGIDVAGESGTAVKAAADGVVVYSGSGLVGYGELVIVKHNDAWLSAYGHNRARMVNEGAIVKAGQQIAVMGRTGAPREMLHFEIRYNGKPVDPLVYLPKR
ncbi:peptidoglycan DD-metalloendopeptidase family protein [Lysobacter fragariae]